MIEGIYITFKEHKNLHFDNEENIHMESYKL